MNALLALLLSILGQVDGETHQLEVIISDHLVETKKMDPIRSKLVLSNVKSTNPEASLEFDGRVVFPCTVRIPSSIHWDSIRSDKYVLTTLYRESKLQIYTDTFGNFMSISSNNSVDLGLKEGTISRDVDILPILSGITPDTQGFTRKVEDEKRKAENAPQGSWVSRNWMYIGIALFVLMQLGGGAQQ